MKIIKIQEFKNDIYPYRLWVVKDSKPDLWLNDRFRLMEDDCVIGKTSPTSNAMTLKNVILKDTNKFGVVVIIRDKSAHTPPIVAHEAVHATNAFFSYLGMDMGFDHDEHYAYLLAWVVDCIWRTITGKFRIDEAD